MRVRVRIMYHQCKASNWDTKKDKGNTKGKGKGEGRG